MSTATITNTVRDSAGTALAGVPVTIRLMPAGGFRTSDSAELAKTLNTVTNASGVWSVALERNEDISPAGTYYQALEKIPGGERKWNFIAASSGTLLSSLVSTPPSIPATQYLTQDSADARYVLAPGTFGGAPDVTPVTGGDTADAGSEDAYARIDHRHAFAIDTSHLKNSSGSLALSDALIAQINSLPRGVVGAAAVTASRMSSGSTVTDATDLSITFTAVAGRRYRARFYGGIFASGAGATQGIIIHANASNTILRQSFHLCTAQVNHAESTYEWNEPTGGTITRKIRIARNLGSSDNFGVFYGNAAQAATYTIEDIGPALP